MSNGCTLVAGANEQGRGAWHSWIKIRIMISVEVREKWQAI